VRKCVCARAFVLDPHLIPQFRHDFGHKYSFVPLPRRERRGRVSVLRAAEHPAAIIHHVALEPLCCHILSLARHRGVIFGVNRMYCQLHVYRESSLYLLNQTVRKTGFHCVLYSPSWRDSTVSRGHSQAGASETCGKRVQGHFSRIDRGLALVLPLYPPLLLHPGPSFPNSNRGPSI